MNVKTLAFLGFIFLVGINPSLCKETNASRLRRGLPPLPPRSLFRNKDAAGAAASATASSRPSHTPSPPRPRFSRRSGRIQVIASNGSSFGFLGSSIPIASINLSGDPGQDLRVQTISESTPFNVIVMNPDFPSPSYLIASASSSLGLHRLTTIGSSDVDRAVFKFRATTFGTYFAQLATWAIDSHTQEFEVRYMSPDNSKSPLSAVYDTHDNELNFVENVNPVFDAPTSTVKLYFFED